MKHTSGLIAVVAVCLLISTATAQDISTDSYPSEDELWHAVTAGDLTAEQAAYLQELLLMGIPASSPYLLDLIPNLAFFGDTQDQLETDLQTEQAREFNRTENTRPRGRVALSGSAEITDQARTRYRTSADYSFHPDWSASLRIHREFSGRERFVRRTVTYRPQATGLQKLAVGNFTERYGLGLVVGYRGKLVSYSNRVDAESFLYPDFGGFNGASASWAWPGAEAKALLSISRDESVDIHTGATQVRFDNLPVSPGMVVATTFVENRLSGKTVTVPSVALTARHRYGRNHVSTEVAGELGKSAAAAAIVEGRNRFEHAELTYAGWWYGHNYAGITAGSKAAPLWRQVLFDEVDISFADKRCGQVGGYIRTVVDFDQSWRLIGAGQLAAIDRDSSQFKFLGGMEYTAAEQVTVRVDVLLENRRTEPLPDLEDNLDRTVRAELRWRSRDIRLRSYFARTLGKHYSNHSSWFFHGAAEVAREINLSWWSKLTLYDDSDAIYWYGFIKQERVLFDNVTMIARVTHRFDERSRREYLTTVTMELISLL